MNRNLTKLFTFFIPHQILRKRVRGILRYGLLKSIILLFTLKQNKQKSYKNYLSVCAIAKNEGMYFQEWIEWHISKGVEKFYIYDNESTDNTKEILAPYIENGFVEYIYWKGQKQQLDAYDDCLDKHRFDSFWIAFIDLDEFIVPIKDNTIPEYLNKLENFTAIEINWLIYGSSNEKVKKEGGVMERFKYHAPFDHIKNRYVKNIVNPRRIFSFTACHDVAHISGQIVDAYGNPKKRNSHFNEPSHDVIRINHYPVKSYEEFLMKKSRGSTSTLKDRYVTYFNKYDLNDIKDENEYLEVKNEN